MAAGLVQLLGSLAVFTRDDFEGDWRRVASGGFGQVFRVRHRRWRTKYAVQCARCLQPEAARYLLALPRSVQRGGLRPGERPREGWGLDPGTARSVCRPT